MKPVKWAVFGVKNGFSDQKRESTRFFCQALLGPSSQKFRTERFRCGSRLERRPRHSSLGWRMRQFCSNRIFCTIDEGVSPVHWTSEANNEGGHDIRVSSEFAFSRIDFLQVRWSVKAPNRHNFASRRDFCWFRTGVGEGVPPRAPPGSFGIAVYKWRHSRWCSCVYDVFARVILSPRWPGWLNSFLKLGVSKNDNAHFRSGRRFRHSTERLR